MKNETYWNGRGLSRDEIETLKRLIAEANFGAIIGGEDIIIQVDDEDGTSWDVASIGLLQLIAFSADQVKQLNPASGVAALAGLLSKCLQVVLNEMPPYLVQEPGDEEIGFAVRLRAEA